MINPHYQTKALLQSISSYLEEHNDLYEPISLGPFKSFLRKKYL